MRERVGDRGGSRDDRRLTEPLGADIRQVRVGDMGKVDHDLGHIGDRRDLVVVEVRIEGDAGRRVDDQLFREGKRHPLQHPTLDLAGGGQRVDDPSDVVHRHDPLDPHLAELRVDCHLRNLAAERVHDKAVGVDAAGAGAVDRRVTELTGHLRHVDIDRTVVRADAAVRDLEVARRDLEHVTGELQQGLAHLRRRRPYSGHHRRRRLRPARNRAVHVRRRVAAHDANAIEREAELLGRHDLCSRQRAGTDVLDSGDHRCVPVGVEPHRRVRRRPAATPPDLRRAAHAALEPVPLCRSQHFAVGPAGELRRPVVASKELLAGVRQPALLVDIGVIAAAQLERVEVER